MRALLHHYVDEAAARTPGHEAVRCNGEALTYAALAEQSDRLAQALTEAGVRKGDRVGLLLDRGLRATAAIYGVLKAGAAYVPIDLSAPVARQAFVLKDGGIRHIVTEPSRRRALAALAEVGVRLDACVGVEDGDGLPGRGVSWGEVEGAPPSPPASGVTADDLAYVLYTSGSTGVPKGVAHTHRSARAWAEGAVAAYGLRADDRVSSHAPLHFDLSTLDYFATAAAGATTVVIPELYTKVPASLSALMASERLTVLYVVPLALTHLLLHGALGKRDLGALRWVLFGGEPFAPKHVRALMAAWPHARFANVYGPTEVNGVTTHVIPPDYAETAGDAPLPIGPPLPFVEAVVVGASDEAVPPGAAGELLVRTPTMMQGYWNRPDFDARAFARRLGADGAEHVFHRTGDLVRQDADGTLHFLGRKDLQVKVRGYRVDLAEVEAVLEAHRAVTAAAVYTVPDADGVLRIEAAATLRSEAVSGDAPDLRRHAADHLPPYAVPDAIAVVDRFPQTSSGKIDRRALAAARVPATP